MAYASVSNLVSGDVVHEVQQVVVLVQWYRCPNETEDDVERDEQEQMTGVSVIGRDLMRHFRR
jgi:hypothetical protein